MNPPSSEKVQIRFDLRRKVGDSNPRYGNPYVSLANWWFQPLTQPSKCLEKFLAEPLLSNAMQRYNIFLKPPNFFINFFLISCKSITFCDKHHRYNLKSANSIHANLSLFAINITHSLKCHYSPLLRLRSTDIQLSNIVSKKDV